MEGAHSPKPSEGGPSSATSLAADAAVESGPGELSDDGQAAPSGEDMGAGRRGASSIRERTLRAFEEAVFPSYPAEPPAEAPFALPPGCIDQDAPLSARKWELSQTLASFAVDLMQKRRQRLEHAPQRAKQQHHSQQQHHRYSIAEEKAGRTRRPTAIMRSNVEVARLMGVPGSKQRQLSHDDMAYEEEAPQHLSTTRHKKGEASPSAGEEHSGGANGVAHSADEGKRARGSGGRGRQNGHTRPGPLPVMQTVPAVISEMPVILSNATTHAILPAAVPSPEELGGRVQRRVVNGVVVKPPATSGGGPSGGGCVSGGGGSGPPSTSGPPSGDAHTNKRKRRMPGWLAEHEQGEDADDDGDGDAGAAAGATPPATPTSAGEKRRNGVSDGAMKRRPILSVTASICAKDEPPPPPFVHVVPCAVTVIGVLPPPQARSRPPAMPPPLAPKDSAGSHTEGRSPKNRTLTSGEQRERERKLAREASRDGKEAVGEDAFSFGDLPSPRIIEVVRAKEIHLPQWRLLPADKLPAALKPDWVPPRGTKSARGGGRGGGGGGNQSSSSKAARSAGGAVISVGHGGAANGVAYENGEGDEDEGNADEVYERRHARTLECAIAAARQVAQELFQKERQKREQQQQANGDGKSGEGSHGHRVMTEEEEWRFRPSELAALCAAQRMGASAAAAAAAEAAAAGGNAGFFGRMGGNRTGLRDAQRERDEGDEGGEGKANGDQDAGGAPLSARGTTGAPDGAAPSTMADAPAPRPSKAAGDGDVILSDVARAPPVDSPAAMAVDANGSV